MNYILQIRAFYDLQLTNDLTHGQAALWHALMHINNLCAWKDRFTVANSRLELLTGLSRKGIYDARNVLRQKGYIDFASQGTKATEYHIIDLTLQHFTQDTTQTTTQGATQDTTQTTTQGATQTTTTLDKQNKTKLKQNKTEGAKKFTPPSLDEVTAYCLERKNGIDPQRFVDFYSAKGWMVGKNKMKDWKACVRTWEARNGTSSSSNPQPSGDDGIDWDSLVTRL